MTTTTVAVAATREGLNINRAPKERGATGALSLRQFSSEAVQSTSKGSERARVCAMKGAARSSVNALPPFEAYTVHCGEACFGRFYVFCQPPFFLFIF